MDKFKGKVWVFGDNVDTDQIIPAERLVAANLDHLNDYIFEKVRPGFAQQVQKGDILVDDVDIEPNEADGWHRIQAGNGYGRSYILLNPTRVNKRLRYPFEVKEDGRYTVYTYYIRRGESSKVTEIIVGNGKMEDRIKLDAGAITVKGQTSGEWVALGEYDFQAGDKCYVDFTNNGEVTGQICADAVLAVKKR